MPRELSIRPLKPGEGTTCRAIMQSLPDWFGIAEAVAQYARDAEAMETYLALRVDEAVGFLTLNRHSNYSWEIQAMAVRKDHHRTGVGRALVAHAEAALRARGVEFLQVKTLGPSRNHEPYARTRRFYEVMGFRMLEENRLWGDRNPCLIMVKHLGCAHEM